MWDSVPCHSCWDTSVWIKWWETNWLTEQRCHATSSAKHLASITKKSFGLGLMFSADSMLQWVHLTLFYCTGWCRVDVDVRHKDRKSSPRNWDTTPYVISRQPTFLHWQTLSNNYINKIMVTHLTTAGQGEIDLLINTHSACLHQVFQWNVSPVYRNFCPHWKRYNMSTTAWPFFKLHMRDMGETIILVISLSVYWLVLKA